MSTSIDFTTLRVVVAAAELGSISGASHRLNLAVAAASARVSALEETLGFKIFVRTARGVHLTLDGQMLVRRSQLLVADADRLYADLHDYARGLKGYVRVMANTSSLLEVLPAKIAEFSRQHPMIQVGLEESGSPEIAQALLEGRADMGFVDLPLAPNGLTLTEFFKDTLVLLVPQGHALLRHERILLQDAMDYEFISLAESTALSNRLAVCAATTGKAMHIRMRMRSFDAVTRMVAAGLGICVLPLEGVSPQLATLPVKVIPLLDSWARRTHHLAVRSDAALSPAAKTFIAALKG